MTIHLAIEIPFSPIAATTQEGHPLPLRRVVHVVRGRPGPDDRPALPPGHPDTWGLINAGTCLEGSPYPFPIFSR